MVADAAPTATRAGGSTDQRRPMRVVHCTGSPVDANWADLSRLYAANALDALRSVSVNGSSEHLVVDVSPDDTWRFPTSLEPAALESAQPLDRASAISHLAAFDADVAVPQMFCPPGLTTHRALLDLLCIPSVGNNATTMAITADKAIARAVVAAVGIDVPNAMLLQEADDVGEVDFPVVVKPVDADNSTGVSLAADRCDLLDAVAEARTHGTAVLVEDYVPLGREVRCGTIRRSDGTVMALPVEEYAVSQNDRPIRTAADKLGRDSDGELQLMAKSIDRAWIIDDDDPIVPAVHDLARRAHHALGCRHHGLVDVRIDPSGRPWFIEAGPYCSFAPSSVVVTMAAAAGIDLGELFGEAVESALSILSRPRRSQ